MRIFDAEMQAKLNEAYCAASRGKERVCPAQLALAALLQAALRVPDHEVVELTVMDKRWQMVLDCSGQELPLFSQGTFFNFRQRMIEHGLDKALFEKTIRLARETGGFSATHLRTAFDASPLWGAGRVEDTFNLIGRSALHVVRTAAQRRGMIDQDVAKEAGIPVVVAASIKTGLVIDWDDPNARTNALRRLLTQLQSLGAWLAKELTQELSEPPLAEQWALVQKLIEQDTEPRRQTSPLMWSVAQSAVPTASLSRRARDASRSFPLASARRAQSVSSAHSQPRSTAVAYRSMPKKTS